MRHVLLGMTLQSILNLSLTAASVAAEEDLAPSCKQLLASYQYKGGVTGGTLLAVVGNQLVDAADATFKRGGKHEFYYVYQNETCKTQPCVPTPIISIKTFKVTGEPTSSVFLGREQSRPDRSLTRSRYEDFHRDPSIRPLGPYEVFNDFHITYRGPEGELYTHFPKERRDTYLFQNIPATQSPWLKVRNYRFKLNPNFDAQCIRFDLTLQRSTESAYVAITEVEDGSGGNPQKADRWPLTLN